MKEQLNKPLPFSAKSLARVTLPKVIETAPDHFEADDDDGYEGVVWHIAVEMHHMDEAIEERLEALIDEVAPDMTWHDRYELKHDVFQSLMDRLVEAAGLKAPVVDEAALDFGLPI